MQQFIRERGVFNDHTRTWMAYGAGVAAIAASTGMSESEVQALVDAEEKLYPEVVQFNADVEHAVKSSRRATSRFLPHPEVPGLVCQIGMGFYRTPDGTKFSFRESPAPAYLVRKGITATFSPTELKNYPTQGTGGMWMKAALWLAVRMFYRRKNFGGLALLINTVHDALYSDAHDSVKEEAAAVLHACMTEASTLVEKHFGWRLPLGVPSDTTWGASMIEESAIPDVAAAAAPHQQEIRNHILGHYTPTFI